MRDSPIGLIPAAGVGSRLGLPYPKELQPLIRDGAYKPVSQFAVESLRRAGAREIVFVVNETKHQLMAYFGGGRRFGCHVSYAYQERSAATSASTPASPSASTSPGLADALGCAHHLVRGRTVLFAMADTILFPEDVFARMLEAWRPEDELAFGLFATSHPEKRGMVHVERDGLVRTIVDKPTTTALTHAWGCVAWRAPFTDWLHDALARGTDDFAAILNGAIASGMRARGVVIPDGHFADMGTFEEVVETERWYRDADR